MIHTRLQELVGVKLTTLNKRFHPLQIQAVESKGASGGKADIVLTMNNGSHIGISCKMKNADFVGNWYTMSRMQNTFSEEVIDKLTNACLSFATTYTPPRRFSNNPFVGVCISFATKRAGNTGINLNTLLSKTERLNIWKGNPNENNKADYVFIGKVPKEPMQCLEKLQLLDEEFKEQNDMFAVFRPVYVKTNRSNLRKQVWAHREWQNNELKWTNTWKKRSASSTLPHSLKVLDALVSTMPTTPMTPMTPMTLPHSLKVLDALVSTTLPH